MNSEIRKFELKRYPRIEFLALRSEIEALQRQGYSIKGIFRKLQEERG